jgi:hypothetical protein
MKITEEDINKKPFVPYPLDRGAPKFHLIDVKSIKDQEYNLAAKQAQQEINKLKEMADVILQQVDQIRVRMELTQQIYLAEYNFKPVPGNTYWLLNHSKKNILMLCFLGPEDWSHGCPESYEYIKQVRSLPNGLWEVA